MILRCCSNTDFSQLEVAMNPQLCLTFPQKRINNKSYCFGKIKSWSRCSWKGVELANWLLGHEIVGGL